MRTRRSVARFLAEMTEQDAQVRQPTVRASLRTEACQHLERWRGRGHFGYSQLGGIGEARRACSRAVLLVMGRVRQDRAGANGDPVDSRLRWSRIRFATVGSARKAMSSIWPPHSGREDVDLEEYWNDADEMARLAAALAARRCPSITRAAMVRRARSALAPLAAWRTAPTTSSATSSPPSRCASGPLLPPPGALPRRAPPGSRLTPCSTCSPPERPRPLPRGSLRRGQAMLLQP